MKPFDNIKNVRDIRKKLGLNQQEFWSCLGVTQSGGSRYESGRTMPKPVRKLLRLVRIEKLDLTQIKADDIAIAHLLQEKNPGLYAEFKKEVDAK